MRNRLGPYVGALLFFFAGLSGVALAAEGFSWIGEMSGLSLVARETEGGKDEIVYSVSGDGREILRKVRAGLQERGWKIHERGEVQSGGTAADTLEASHEGGGHVQIVLSDVMGLRTLTVQGKDAGSAPAATTSGTVSASSAGGNVSITSTGTSGTVSVQSERVSGVVVVNENSRKATYDCDGCVLTVNGNDSDITLLGKATAVTLNGSRNKITAKGTMVAVTVNGDDNSVTWSSDKGPTVVDNGKGNTARRANP